MANHKETAFSGIILVSSCILFYMTTAFPHPEALKGEFQADFWPRMILLGLIGISSFLLIKSLKKNSAAKSQPAVSETAVNEINRKRLVLTGLITFLYLILLDIIGFPILTPIFIFFFLFNMGLRNLRMLVLIPPIITASVFFVFVKLMFVLLPRGTWIFREVSILLY